MRTPTGLERSPRQSITRKFVNARPILGVRVMRSLIEAAFSRLLKCRSGLTTIPGASIFGGSNTSEVFGF